MVSLTGYSILRRDRNGKGGGGVAIYYHNSLRARVLKMSSDSYRRRHEYLIAELELTGACKFLIGLVYRLPKLFGQV